MDWCVAKDFPAANHNPVPALEGDKTRAVLKLQARAGETVTLSAQGTSDPDGDALSVHWYIYPEAGTLGGATLSAPDGMVTRLVLPAGQTGTVHVILDAKDDGKPSLSAYRRTIVEVGP